MCQLDSFDHVTQRQLIAAVARRRETKQLGRGDVRDRELVLRVAGALLPVELLGFVEKGIAQSCRVGIDARVALLSRRNCYYQRCQSLLGRHLDTKTEEGVGRRRECPVYIHTQNKAQRRAAGGSKTQSCGPPDRQGTGPRQRALRSDDQWSGKTK